jgi:hypothetical protein
LLLLNIPWVYHIDPAPGDLCGRGMEEAAQTVDQYTEEKQDEN